MTYTKRLKAERAEKAERLDDIHDKLNMAKTMDENGEPQLSLTNSAIKGLMEEAKELVTAIEEDDNNIAEFERHDAIKTRDRDLDKSPYHGINKTPSNAVVSDFNSIKLGDKLFKGVLGGKTFGETVVAKAMAVNSNKHRLSESIAAVLTGEGAAIPVVMDPNSGVFLDANEVDERDLVQAAEQQFGIDQAMASGYFIDMLPIVNGSGRTIQWNETPTRTNSAGFRRTTTGSGTGTSRQAGSEFEPTSISRTMSPAEFSVYSDIARSTLQERSDAARWLNEEIMLNYKEKASPEAFHSGNTLTGIVGISNAALRNNTNEGKIVDQTANVDISEHVTGKTEQQKYNLLGPIYMGAFIRMRDTLMAQRPGRKVVSCHRNVLTAMQEARATEDPGKMYPGLSEMTPNYAGMTFVPIDVGIEDPPLGGAGTKYVAAMTDWNRDTAHIIAERSIFIDPYTQRVRGVHRYINDGKSGYQWINRFGIALLKVTSTA